MDDQISSDSSAASTLSTISMQQTKTTASECKICGDYARYSYYGAVACQSCKIFFRRNVPAGQDVLKCRFSNECDININNRYKCSACRLKKCFANGMRTEMIRCHRAKKSSNLVTTTLVPLNNQSQPEQIPIANLLQSDQSSLTVDQWNLLSNLVHCYDEYCGYSYVEDYVREQSALPLKLRFKCCSVRDFFTSTLSNIQLVIEKNRDLLSLSPSDRTILLRHTVQYTSSFGGVFTLRQHDLFDYKSFYNSSEMIFRSSSAAFARRAIEQFDPDDTFIKLMHGIFSFSTMNYVVYMENTVISSMNMKAIVSVQDTYVEVAWRYLLYKYNYHGAVIRFLNLIRCVLLLNSSIVEANDSNQFIEMVDTIIERTEQTLCFH